MPANPDRRFRPRMTIRQMGILVALSAIASAVVMPQARSLGLTYEFWLTIAVEVPFVLVIAMLVLVRPGPLKHWMLAALSLSPLPAVLSLMAYPFLDQGTPALSAIVLVLVVVPTTLSFGFVSRWLVPRFCPDCRTLAMLRDLSVPKSRRFPPGSEPRTCLACGARFRRSRGGPWVDVDLLEASPAHVSMKPTSA